MLKLPAQPEKGAWLSYSNVMVLVCVAANLLSYLFIDDMISELQSADLRYTQMKAHYFFDLSADLYPTQAQETFVSS